MSEPRRPGEPAGAAVKALDEAWAAAEAALPDGCAITLWPPYQLADGGTSGTWTVRAEKQIAFGGRGRARYWRVMAEGVTPAAALDALVEATR